MLAFLLKLSLRHMLNLLTNFIGDKNSSAVYCVRQLCRAIVSVFAHFVPVVLAFGVLGLVSSVQRQEIGREERLRNDLILCRGGCETIIQ